MMNYSWQAFQCRGEWRCMQSNITLDISGHTRGRWGDGVGGGGWGASGCWWLGIGSSGSSSVLAHVLLWMIKRECRVFIAVTRDAAAEEWGVGEIIWATEAVQTTQQQRDFSSWGSSSRGSRYLLWLDVSGGHAATSEDAKRRLKV